MEIDKSVRFAHHARGCTIVASKICADVVIFQNVTIGSNLRFRKASEKWENVGNPIISKNVIIADGAKIMGPIVVGENCIIAAGSIVTKDVPANNMAYGVNQFKPKDTDYDLVFSSNMISSEQIIKANMQLIENFTKREEA
jgi:serine O-acetyltransferase